MAFCLKAPEGEDALDFDSFDDATLVGSGLDLEKKRSLSRCQKCEIQSLFHICCSSFQSLLDRTLAG